MYLQYFRLRANLSQKRLAEFCGVSETTIRRLEQSKREPTLHVAVKIARYLGVEPLDIFPLPDEIGSVPVVESLEEVKSKMWGLIMELQITYPEFNADPSTPQGLSQYPDCDLKYQIQEFLVLLDIK